jgi:hypothetical protein
VVQAAESEVLKAAPAYVAPATPAVRPQRAVVERQAQNQIAVFDDNGGVNMAAALMAITEGGGRGELLFPILQLTGGNGGGAFTPIKSVPQEVADQMPQGKKPIDCVFIGYRTELAAWPVGYNDRGAEGGQPVWSMAVPCNAPDDSRLVRGACSSYQFTPGDNKAGWDHAVSGIGHIRPTMQLLVYLPSVNDLIVVQTPSHFISWQQTMENLKKMVDPKTGLLNQFPCVLRAISEPKIIKGNNTTQHTIEFTSALNEAGAGWWKQYGGWRQAAKQDQEIVEKVNQWLNALDKPIDDTLRQTLKKAESYRP